MTSAVPEAEIGILGGSGIYDLSAVTGPREVRLTTPFGDPSDVYVVGRLDGRRVAFLPRHGRGHRLMPTELNYRANIFGFKMLGVTRILSASAVGSMKEGIAPRDIVLPDQFIDRTRHRPDTFFGGGLVAHVSLADPICPEVHRLLAELAPSAGVKVHVGGTYLCMEGPQFSTKAESRLYRSWSVEVIGMTNLQEARLAREAEICYATIALVTDYDCWHETEDAVTVDQVVAVLRDNAVAAGRLISEAVRRMPPRGGCRCGDALLGGILTDRAHVPPELVRRLAPIVGRYFET